MGPYPPCPPSGSQCARVDTYASLANDHYGYFSGDATGNRRGSVYGEGGPFVDNYMDSPIHAGVCVLYRCVCECVCLCVCCRPVCPC